MAKRYGRSPASRGGIKSAEKKLAETRQRAQMLGMKAPKKIHGKRAAKWRRAVNVQYRKKLEEVIDTATVEEWGGEISIDLPWHVEVRAPEAVSIKEYTYKKPGNVSFLILYNMHILYDTDIDQTLKDASRQIGGTSHIKKAQKRPSDIMDKRGLEWCMRRADKKARKEMKKNKLPYRQVDLMAEESELTEEQEAIVDIYTNLLNVYLTEEVTVTVAARNLAWVMSWIKKNVRKEDILIGVARVMAEYIEDGCRERLIAMGLGGSDLIDSINVKPVFYPEVKMGRGGLDIDYISLGVMFTMKAYGFYLDRGRGRTEDTEQRYESYWDSPFFQALLEWALDNLHVTDDRGILKFRDDTTTPKSSVRIEFARMGYTGHEGAISAVRREQFGVLMMNKHQSEKQLESQGVGEWMKQARGTERRMAPPGGSEEYWGEVQRNPASQLRTAMTRGEIYTAFPGESAAHHEGFKGIEGTVESIVYLIYRKLNQVGYEGNRFLTDTLREMAQKGLMEHYYHKYFYDMLQEQAHEKSNLSVAGFRNKKGSTDSAEVKAS